MVAIRLQPIEERVRLTFPLHQSKKNVKKIDAVFFLAAINRMSAVKLLGNQPCRIECHRLI